ncbi:MAG: hypothetical protein M1828_005166 [Chrysothrix sp. TS-e1954]|nr:MAG: hypothetical protein M1828_005166 [Chrysothrix sp. TS-e1954]
MFNHTGLVAVNFNYAIERTRPNDPHHTAYAFHEACYKILKNVRGYVRGRELDEGDVQALHDLCERGLEDIPPCAWSDSTTFPANGSRQGDILDIPQYQRAVVQSSDPLDIPEVRRAVIQNVSNFYILPVLARCDTGVRTASEDIFHILPDELIQAIFRCLPSKAVRSLKLASPTCARSPPNATFWATRFHQGNEYEHIFEVWDANEKVCWQQTYLALSILKEHKPLLNRRRIWDEALCLSNLMDVDQAADRTGNA